MDIELLKKLSNADAISSNESEVRGILKEVMEPLCDNVYTDNIGSIIFQKNGNPKAPKIMIAAHIDEVGFKVKNISPQGQIFVKAIGGVKSLAKFMQSVRITTQDRKKIKGFLQSTYTEDMPLNKIPDETYVNVGATSKDEVLSLGINVGDMVCFDSNFHEMDARDIIMGKALDDRVGCYILANILKNLNDRNVMSNLYFVGTSSEETDMSGAKTATAKINPDLAFVLDCCCHNDEFDYSFKNKRQLGKGMILNLSERGYEPNQKLLRIVEDYAKKLNKNIQLDMFNTGRTDASFIHSVGNGVPTVTINIPLHYGHCAYSLASIKDMQDCVDVLTDLFINADAELLYDCSKFL